MPTNINLTREIAIQLIKNQEVTCPNCGEDKLRPRYTDFYKHANENPAVVKTVGNIAISNITYQNSYIRPFVN